MTRCSKLIEGLEFEKTPQNVQDFIKKYVGRGKTVDVLQQGRHEVDFEVSGQRGLNKEALQDMFKDGLISIAASKKGNLILTVSVK